MSSPSKCTTLGDELSCFDNLDSLSKRTLKTNREGFEFDDRYRFAKAVGCGNKMGELTKEFVTVKGGNVDSKRIWCLKSGHFH